MLCDNKNLLYFKFLCPLIKELEHLNAQFQSSNPNMTDLYNLLDMHYRSVKSRVYDDHDRVLHVSRCDLGASFEQLARTMDPVEVRDVRERCKTFLISLLEELEKRLPTNKNILKDVGLFSPVQVLSPNTKFANLPFQEHCLDIDSVESQLRKLKQVDWSSVGPWEKSIPADPVEFWAFVAKYEVCGEKIFKDIADYALTVLSLPASNSYVERVFSIVSFVKDKYANRMSLGMLDSLLLLKTHLQASINLCFIHATIFY
jgi:hypothetical protein